MDTGKTVETFITALQSGDLELAASLLADEFTLSGFTPVTLSRQKFLALQSDLLAAMPDFSYNLSDVRAEQDRVQAQIQITGTNQHDLSLPTFGLQSISATGLAIVLPQVPAEFHVADSKIRAMKVESRPGSGLSGLLQQIGAELPVQPREKVFEDPAYAEDTPDMTEP